MCGNNCSWIIILILLFTFCGGNCANTLSNNGGDCGCNNNNGCGCGCN